MMSRSTGSKLTTATGESKAAMLESSRGTDSTSYSEAERWAIILTCNHFASISGLKSISIEICHLEEEEMPKGEMKFQYRSYKLQLWAMYG